MGSPSFTESGKATRIDYFAVSLLKTGTCSGRGNRFCKPGSPPFLKYHFTGAKEGVKIMPVTRILDKIFFDIIVVRLYKQGG